MDKDVVNVMIHIYEYFINRLSTINILYYKSYYFNFNASTKFTRQLWGSFSNIGKQ